MPTCSRSPRPTSAQFLEDEFTLARLDRNDPTVADRAAEVRLASAETGAAKPVQTAKPAIPPAVQAVAGRPEPQPPMIHRASFTAAEAPTKAATPKPATPKSATPKSATPRPRPRPGPRCRRQIRQAGGAAHRRGRSAEAEAGIRSARREAGGQVRQAVRAAGRVDAIAKPEPAPARTAAKPSAKPETLRTAAAAKPLREAAAAPRSKGKGGGGN